MKILTQPELRSVETLAMHPFKNRSEVALYVWDYFFASKGPAPGDEKVWAVIERATCRILESESSLGASTPPDVRLRSARRVRNAARLATRQIKRLSVAPERWVVDGLLELEAQAVDVIQMPSGSAGRVLVH